MDIKNLTGKLLDFRNKRGWGKHHTGPELARALFVECGELNELFLWGIEPGEGEYQNLRDEIADNFIYLLYMCDKYNIDPETAILKKIEKNGRKYPV
jgi:NTP pyrophosphatase (non-canonical NTP hydrolase)